MHVDKKRLLNVGFVPNEFLIIQSASLISEHIRYKISLKSTGD